MLLVSAMVLTTSCGTKSVEPEEAVIPEVTHEFAITADYTWVNSNYKKYWYKYDDALYNESRQAITPDKEICGYDLMPKESEYGLMEKTAYKKYIVKSEDEKYALLENLFRDNNYINGEGYNGTLTTVFNGVKYLDIYQVSNITMTGMATVGENVVINTHVLPSCNREITIPIKIEEQVEVIDQDGNCYYGALKLNDFPNSVFVPLNVVKHVIGWEVAENPDGKVTVWVDDIYKPHEEAIVVSPEEAQNNTTSGTYSTPELTEYLNTPATQQASSPTNNNSTSSHNQSNSAGADTSTSAQPSKPTTQNQQIDNNTISQQSQEKKAWEDAYEKVLGYVPESNFNEVDSGFSYDGTVPEGYENVHFQWG